MCSATTFIYDVYAKTEGDSKNQEMHCVLNPYEIHKKQVETHKMLFSLNIFFFKSAP